MNWKAIPSVVLLFGLGSQLQAQTPIFLPAVENPFGLEGLAQFGIVYRKPSFGDIDGDGDLDILFAISSDNFQTRLLFATNVGSPEAPFFIAPSFDSYGVDGDQNIFAYNADYVDLDADGDLDILVAGLNAAEATTNLFYENIGTSSAPSFAPPQVNPFGFGGNQNFLYLPYYGDLDSDGDLDILAQAFGDQATTLPFVHYYENISAGNTTSFQGPSVQPFNFNAPGFYGYHFLMGLADLDLDGDLDLAAQVEFDGIGPGDPEIITFGSIENFGNAVSPAFLPPDTSLLNISGLTDVPSLTAFTLVDLDNDGDLDIVSSEEYGATLYYENVQTASSVAPLDQLTQLNVSPNPVLDYINLASEAPVMNVKIIAVNGNTIFEVADPGSTLNLSELASGIYFLRIKLSNGQVVIRKIRKAGN